MSESLIIIAVVALLSAPSKGYDTAPDENGDDRHVVRHPPLYHVIGWVVACVAMMAGAVAIEVLK